MIITWHSRRLGEGGGSKAALLCAFNLGISHMERNRTCSRVDAQRTALLVTSCCVFSRCGCDDGNSAEFRLMPLGCPAREVPVGLKGDKHIYSTWNSLADWWGIWEMIKESMGEDYYKFNSSRG